ncbi:DevR family CRISPR-associated autoregulator [Gloeothece verrucosa]|uniref:CRISPR-associated regulatory protein, DevR family n=1 Tax=Gloeothece verrucosa (strain PCC 7822) TaxID=497965 RepID=E0UMR5_GLOV7|nr:DevR family CRISPR-associated autoregulator [Gloeothece verrucosa]ADN18245.1 CRISPR-associated regulatory protein, DevR family [Gloeothece verrucosa PCC 7822]
MFYLFGTVITHYGPASLNHEKARGNVSPLQKTYWDGHIHSLVSGDAIRWGLRYTLQKEGYPINRRWNEDEFTNDLVNENFDPVEFVDDDLFGYMYAEAAKEDIQEEEPSSTGKERRNQTKGSIVQRLGALGVNRGVSLIPYTGALTFNAKSGKIKDRTALHFLEYHNTRYQYTFALDPNHLKVKERILAFIDALMNIRKVGGNNNVFCYKFTPESFVLCWTQRETPGIFYCFEEGDLIPKMKSEVLEDIEVGDIKASELWIGGRVAKGLKIKNAHIFRGKEQAIEDLKKVIVKDLELSYPY